jgi:hypothetical protein
VNATVGAKYAAAPCETTEVPALELYLVKDHLSVSCIPCSEKARTGTRNKNKLVVFALY